MIFRNFNRKWFLLLLAAGIAGCSKEYGGEIPVPEEGSEVTITVNIPAPQTPSTRSIDGVGEAVVESIDLLVFNADGTLAEHVVGESISQSKNSGDNYKVQFKAKLSANTSASAVAIIANASEQVDDVVNEDFAHSAYGKDKAVILRDLIYATSNPGGTAEGWKWNADDEGYTPIPMYGEELVGEIKSGMKIDNVPLTRMLARIDVVNAASGFTLTDVYVVNYNTAGYIAPVWSADEAPMNPQTGEGKALSYSDSNGISSLKGEFYTYEAKATSGIEGESSHTDAMCVIVKGVWSGNEYFYRIDFTAGEDTEGNKVYLTDGTLNSACDLTSIDYMSVYRNCLYTFTISAVNGAGYGSFEAARASLGVLNNLKTRLHVVEQSGIKDMVFNEQHYLGVDRTSFFIEETGGYGEATIFTNAKDLGATASYVIDPYNPMSDWIDGFVIHHVSGDEYILRVVITNANTEPQDRFGAITLTAGRLSLSLGVMQAASTVVTPTFLSAPRITWDVGNSMYAITEDPGDLGLYFKFGSVVGVFSNMEVFDITTVAWCPLDDFYITGWGSIPYTSGIQEIAHTVESVKGGKGDPCRLVGLNLDWIKDAGLGDLTEDDIDNRIWRLPTSAENVNFVGGQSYTSNHWWNSSPSGVPGGEFPTANMSENVENFLPAAGYREHTNGILQEVGVSGRYHSSDRSGTLASYLLFYNSEVNPAATINKLTGLSVRCVHQ